MTKLKFSFTHYDLKQQRAGVTIEITLTGPISPLQKNPATGTSSSTWKAITARANRAYGSSRPRLRPVSNPHLDRAVLHDAVLTSPTEVQASLLACHFR